MKRFPKADIFIHTATASHRGEALTVCSVEEIALPVNRAAGGRDGFALTAVGCLLCVFGLAGCGPKNPLPQEAAPAWMQPAAAATAPAGVQEGFSEGAVPMEAGAESSYAWSGRRLTRVPVENLPDGRRIQQVWIWQETDDCLWNMAREFYGDPFLWPKIFEANRDIIRDPRVIYPKQRLVIPPLDEQ